MIERLEVTPGNGTVIRFGGIVAWADSAASPALISFLAQSARNLGPSPRGGRQIADHIASVLTSRDPEPQVGFAVVGPSDHGWATLMHGPAQAWDGAKWLAPARSPGWVQAIITARPTVTVGPAGSPLPAVQPDSMLDLEAGVVPGAGFLLVPAIRSVRIGAVAGGTSSESLAAGEERPPDAGAAGTATEVLAVGGALVAGRGGPPADGELETDGGLGLAGWQEPGQEPVPGDEARAGASPGPGGHTGVGRESDFESGAQVGAELLAAGAGAHALRSEADVLDPGPEVDPTRMQPAVEAPGDEPLTVEMRALESDAGAADNTAAEAVTSGPEAQPGPETGAAALRRRRRRPAVPGPPGSLSLESIVANPRPPLPLPGVADERIPGLPTVAGVRCLRGHLNRAGLASCVKCGSPIDEAAEQASGTRPPIGVIVTDDGAIYRLDQGYVVGSDPRRDPTVGGGLARPLPLSGVDVSSAHAEIRLQEWDAMVVDRGSAAGTSVFEPGAGEWTRCRPFEPRLLPPGTHVAFGQRVVTFLGPWRGAEGDRPGR